MLKKPSELSIVIVGHDAAVRTLFSKRKYNVRTITALKDPKEYDAVVFTGGADISPYLYGQGLHPKTYPDYARDLREMAVLRRVPRLKPKIGICRGGQLLNVYSGGSMYQEVDNHKGGHKAKCHLTNKEIFITSLHHQGMKPSSDALILMTASVAKKRETYDDVFDMSTTADGDIEACFYEHTMSYCFQGHPEYSYAPDSEEYFFKHLDFVFGEAWSHKEEAVEPQQVRCG